MPVRISRSIPNARVAGADRVAKHAHISRNGPNAKVVEGCVRNLRDAEVTARLNIVYRTHASRVDPTLAKLQRRAMVADVARGACPR